MKTDSIETAIDAIAAGRMVVVVDDENRENEGDLIMAAQAATEADLAFMVRYTSGVLCVSLPAERLEALSLPLMVATNSDSMSTAFTVSTDYGIGTTTRISAADRAITVRALVDEKAVAGDFNRPGHVFPLRAAPGGVLRRAGSNCVSSQTRAHRRAQVGGAIAHPVWRVHGIWVQRNHFRPRTRCTRHGQSCGLRVSICARSFGMSDRRSLRVDPMRLSGTT
jgi:3,4-dihydroxy-2-butanone 4-phosphate synthase